VGGEREPFVAEILGGKVLVECAFQHARLGRFDGMYQDECDAGDEAELAAAAHRVAANTNLVRALARV